MYGSVDDDCGPLTLFTECNSREAFEVARFKGAPAPECASQKLALSSATETLKVQIRFLARRASPLPGGARGLVGKNTRQKAGLTPVRHVKDVQRVRRRGGGCGAWRLFRAHDANVFH